MPTDYAALLAELAVPRLVGTPNHATVRAALRRELAARGLDVEEHPFTARPSRLLFGAPRRIQGMNLVARRPGTAAEPAVWLAAHYDSKGQPISMATRLLGAGALALGVVAAALAPLAGAVLGVAGLAVLANNRVTDRSPGAVDNASALVAVLMLLDLMPPTVSVGVLFLDAEELGLLGAGALVAERAGSMREAAVINLDGLDDGGSTTAVLHRPGPVGRAVARALGARAARWLPVVVDGIVLARAARECVTILRGGWDTARIVHTPRDSADRLTLAGARGVAEGVARALQRA